MKVGRSPLLCSLLALLFLTSSRSAGATSSPPSNGIILRVRLQDGTMQKIQVPSGKEGEITLAQALTPFGPAPDDAIQVGSSNVADSSLTLAALNITHGALISIVASKKASSSSAPPSFGKAKQRPFDPYPEIAKDYTAAKRLKTRRSGIMTYGDVANLQSNLHVVDPQPKGPLERVYMCRISAERLQCMGPNLRVGLLLGTISRERLDTRPAKVRTSLSTSVAPEYCEVAKVHAMWDPPQEATPTHYDAKALVHHPRVRQLAEWLDLVPIGWIYSHCGDRSKDEATLPVHGQDILVAAKLQILQMQASGSDRWATLSMDVTTGATEAFQLSNVAVQMVAEDMIKDTEGRFVTTVHPVLVDGKETTMLDTVLCLVNTAMLAHDGKLAGSTSSTVKKNGMMLTKTKKALLAALEKDTTDHCSLLNALCDFNVLLAIDKQTKSDQMEALCQLVKKWSRGQKIGTQVSPQLKTMLKGILSQ